MSGNWPKDADLGLQQKGTLFGCLFVKGKQTEKANNNHLLSGSRFPKVAERPASHMIWLKMAPEEPMSAPTMVNLAESSQRRRALFLGRDPMVNIRTLMSTNRFEGGSLSDEPIWSHAQHKDY